ncbi:MULTISPECIES: TetR family transcriptional regulator [Nitrincola]|uniref:HTH-type transcriptional repressor BepR n=1 Tax=Nitrincola nitratireducens TaxID=1229521 RepID=W9UTP8_9GAMM|nr:MULTISPECIES: TetR family transcriptional regulator [Nitrincola]EXJ10454.1 HTH-type transcriptional repressor BepR [Nitrincola nitratireducens]
MPRRTKEESEQTRSALLTKALELYADRGIEHVSLKEIAAQAGVTHGAIYWHFKNRDDLLFQIYHQIELPFEIQYIEQRQAAKQNPLQALQDYLMGVIHLVTTSISLQQGYRLFFRLPASPALASMAERIMEDREMVTSHLRYFLKQAKKHKLLEKKLSVILSAQSLSLVLFGLLDQSLTESDPKQYKAQAQNLIHIVMQGISAEKD